MQGAPHLLQLPAVLSRTAQHDVVLNLQDLPSTTNSNPHLQNT